MKTDPHRNSTISRTILDCLDLASPYALPAESLRTECNARIRPPADAGEFGKAMEAMQARKAIAIVPDGFDDDLVKWTITEVGKSLLAQMA